MLDKIERDRLKELQAREDRIQKFMNNMAHNVLAEQDQANRDEDMKLMKFYMDSAEHDKR